MKAILYDDGKDSIGSMETLYDLINDNAAGVATYGDPTIFYDARGKNVAAYMEEYMTNLYRFSSKSKNDIKDLVVKNTREYNKVGFVPAAVSGKIELAAEVQSRMWGTYTHQLDGYNAAKYLTGKRFTAANFTKDQKDLVAAEYNKYFPNKEIIEIDNKLALLNEKFNKLKKTSTIKPAELNSLKKEIDKVETDKKNFEKQLISLDRDLEKKTIKVENNLRELDNFNKNLNPLNNKLASLKLERTNLSLKLDEQIAKSVKDLELKGEADAKIASLKNQYDNEIKDLTNRINNSQAEAKKVSQTIDLINSDVKDINIKNTKLQNQISSINDQINQNQLNINSKQASLDLLNEELVPLNTKLSLLNSDKIDLSTKLSKQIQTIEKEMKKWE